MIRKSFHFLRRRAASLWLNSFRRSTTQIAVTGSYGKTSTTSAIYAALFRAAPTVMTDLNLDTIYNVPITALRVRPEHRFVVFELGIDRPGEMDFHLRIARPSISVVTGITPVHADAAHVGSLEAIIQQKGRVVEVLPPHGAAVLNHDDANVRGMAARSAAKVFFYGASKGSDYRVTDLQLALSGTRFTLIKPDGDLKISTHLLGKHSAVNLAGAAAVAHLAGVPNDTIREAFADLAPLLGRFSVEPGPDGLILINDALRANPQSTRAGLEFLASLATQSRRIAVIGEMGELGEHAIPEHASVGAAAALANPDLLITVGELTRFTADNALRQGLSSRRIHAAANVHEAAEVLKSRSQPGDIVLLKGSLMRHVERIRMILEGQRVGCTVVSCPFYHQCAVCEYLESGYPG